VLGEVGEMVVGEPVVGAQLRLGQVAREIGIGRSARLIGRVRRRVVLRADGSRGASA
jgi:alkylated DNA nucleotide flippase Atl1